MTSYNEKLLLTILLIGLIGIAIDAMISILIDRAPGKIEIVLSSIWAIMILTLTLRLVWLVK